MLLSRMQIGFVALALVSFAFAEEEGETKWSISGFVDAYYAYNTVKPATVSVPSAHFTFKVDNLLHNFNFRDRRPSLQLVELVVERPIEGKSFGFRLDLNAGRTAEWVGANEPAGRSWSYIQQAFISIPMGKGYLDLGKFVTHHGAEVIETKDNWNYTRSLLFAWAIPYYHTGIRYWLPIGKTDKLCLHLYQGWNSVDDNNGSKSFGILWSRSSEAYSLTLNYTGGAELANSSRLRHLVDIVFVKPLNSKDTLMLNADWARDNAAGATWYGVAAYWRRQIRDGHFLTLRAEWFRDPDGFATGTSQTVKELTLTYKLPVSGLRGTSIWLELRQDSVSYT
ncbi:MAG: porin, partial [Armatimonadetes bacterium]|nr:porin [Armatimonadota bacterium]